MKAYVYSKKNNKLTNNDIGASLNFPMEGGGEDRAAEVGQKSGGEVPTKL